jgi:hypothetical protein
VGETPEDWMVGKNIRDVIRGYEEVALDKDERIGVVLEMVLFQIRSCK